jgi:transposase-like protein
MSVLSEKHYQDEEAAYAWVEARVWPQGPVCPHCGCAEEHVGKLAGKSTRVGVYKCYGCRKPFTVKVGTIFESSHVKMHLWLQAMFLMCSSKKGISANQLHRILGVTLKTAWFMAHRIREAMKDSNPTPMGGEGVTVEADETFTGPTDYVFRNGEGWQKRRGGYAKPYKIMTLVERGGRARSLKVEDLDAATIANVLSGIDPKSALHTDQAHHYKKPGKRFAKHETVNHSEKEYARGDVTTNTVEGFFSIFKRGMVGVYQQCGEQHLQRYLTEFDFRYSNRKALGIDDVGRTERAVSAIVGKRLTYRTVGRRA